MFTLVKEAENAFKRMLLESGYREAAVDELWKWFDFAEKKGVASFWNAGRLSFDNSSSRVDVLYINQ